ncbi:MAG TPA: glutamine-hydrolyzing GMP synthase [Candidatus Brocadiia bacterium]|nr:glutamine-hydrolyzing GMP synthase [Candidatus Brocadiia bacterium]
MCDLPMTHSSDRILILDFRSQYVQLIARRVRENQVFSEIVPCSITPEQVRAIGPAGMIFSGGPASVYAKGAPTCDPALLRLGIPVLGICYGMQLGCKLLGADVQAAPAREYGHREARVVDSADLFTGLPATLSVWMSHGDQVSGLGNDFVALAATDSCPFAAARHRTLPFYGVQFHPEVTHTPLGGRILHNFLFRVCGCTGSWRTTSFIEEAVKAIRDQVGSASVVCGLSGGVDSAVTAALVHRAIGSQLTCILVDNGLMRDNEVESVRSAFEDHFRARLVVADAADLFLERLAGVRDPEKKRKIIGHTFIEVFERESRKLKDVRFLAQGTLYPDVIESQSPVGGPSATIKSHHNVGGLPAKLGFQLVEPLRLLFKDEVRATGATLGLPEAIIWRHPFPGPGLAVRIIGEVTRERLAVLRRADVIFLEEVVAEGWYRKIAQAFCVLLPEGSVGVMGDERTYGHVIAVRAVESQDFMTADWVPLPHDLLARVSNRIINNVKGVNRVVYDISSKPPSTIEWE